MWWVSDARDERGVVAVVVALLLTVLCGIAALVVDAAAVYAERRELQNGADAGALAVAQDCALGNCGSYTSTATGLADANSEDGASTVDDVTIDLAAQTASVSTSTDDPEGGTLIPFRFAPIFGIGGENVDASATAQWGPLANGKGLPLAISTCEWERTVSDVTDLPSATVTITFHDGNSTEPCNGPAGQDVPGGFGWLDESGCATDITVDGGGTTASSNTGVSVPAGCSLADFPLGTPILFPIFDGASGTGTNGTFHIVGWAALELSAYKLAPGNQWTAGSPTCPSPAPAAPLPGGGNGGQPANGGGGGNDAVCLVGRFVDYFEADGNLGGPGLPNFGVQTAELIA